MKTFLKILLLVAGSAPFTGCDDPSRVYELNQDLADATWQRSDAKDFSFTIEDTQPSYNLLYNVRHTINYPFSNLYLQYELKDSTGKVLFENLQEVFLFEPQTGNPAGFGTFLVGKTTGDLYDHQYPFLPNCRFSNPGTYTISVQQYMREPDPLNDIAAIGVRVEKVMKEH